MKDKFRRAISMLLLVCMIISLMGVTAYAADPVPGTDFLYAIETSDGTVTQTDSTKATVELPTTGGVVTLKVKFPANVPYDAGSISVKLDEANAAGCTIGTQVNPLNNIDGWICDLMPFKGDPVNWSSVTATAPIRPNTYPENKAFFEQTVTVPAGLASGTTIKFLASTNPSAGSDRTVYFNKLNSSYRNGDRVIFEIKISDPADVAATSVTAPAITGTVGKDITTVTATQTGGTAGGRFTVAGLPSGLKIDPNTGVISGKTSTKGTGSYTVTYTTPGGKSTKSDTATWTINVPPVVPGTDFLYAMETTDGVVTQTDGTKAVAEIPTTGGDVTLKVKLPANVPYDAASISVKLDEANAAGCTIGTQVNPLNNVDGWICDLMPYKGDPVNWSSVTATAPVRPNTYPENKAFFEQTVTVPAGVTAGTTIKFLASPQPSAGSDITVYFNKLNSRYKDGNVVIFEIKIVDSYTLTYNVTGDAPATFTPAIPAASSHYAGEDVTIIPALTTTETTKAGVPGTWTFSGWTPTPSLVNGKMPAANVTVNGSWTFQKSDIAATTVTAPDITGTAGEDITPVTATQTGGTTGGRFTATGLPSGLKIDSNTGAISGKVTASGNGTYTVTYTTPGGKATKSNPANWTINARPVVPGTDFLYAMETTDGVVIQTDSTKAVAEIPTTGGVVTLKVKFPANVPYDAGSISVKLDEANAAGCTIGTQVNPLNNIDGWICDLMPFKGDPVNWSSVTATAPVRPNTYPENKAFFEQTVTVPAGVTAGTTIKFLASTNPSAGSDRTVYFNKLNSRYKDGDCVIFEIKIVDSYTLTYNVTGDAPATFTPAIPAASSHYAGEDITIAAGLTTTETSKGGVPGTWTFSGWTPTPSLVNGKMPASDVVVNGSWLFTPDSQYSLTYQVTGDAPATFTPAIPAASNHYAGDDITLAADLTTTQKTKGGVPGTWTFSGWTPSPALVGGKMPAANVVVSGSWTFRADPQYTLTYQVTGEAPATFTPAIPAVSNHYAGDTIGIIRDLTTTETTKGTVPGRWTFSGWTIAPSLVGGRMPAANVVISGSWTFTADPQYSLTYEITGEKPATYSPANLPAASNHYAGETITLAPVPTTTETSKDGEPGRWAFRGWILSPALVNGKMPAGNVVARGNWEFRKSDIAATSVTAPDITGTVGVNITPVTATQTGGTAGGRFTAEGLPSGLKIDLNTGVISGKTSTRGTGTYTVTYITPEGRPTKSNNATWTINVPPVVPGSDFLYAMETTDGVVIQTDSTKAVAEIPTTGGVVTLKVKFPANVPYDAGSISVKLDEANAAGCTIGTQVNPLNNIDGWICDLMPFKGDPVNWSSVTATAPVRPNTYPENKAFFEQTVTVPAGVTAGTTIKFLASTNPSAGSDRTVYFNKLNSRYKDGDCVIFEIKIVDSYTLTYNVTGDAPATFTPAIPAASSHYAGEDITIAAGLTTTETSKGGVPGTWTFSGWTPTPSLVNGKMPASDVVVNGSWLFTPDSQYSLTYQVTGEAPATFTPAIPAASNHYAGDDITIEAGLTTTETKKGSVPGTWTFSGWTPSPALVGGKMPAANVVVSGSWTFRADPQYTLTYQVTGEAPATFTPAIPAVSSHYAGDDITLAAGLTTTETSKGGVPGTWIFSGWTPSPALVGGKMPAANVVVSGSWTFRADPQYTLTYQVTGEAPATFTPAIPAVSSHYAGDDITLAAGLTTTETSKGGVPGTWTFSGWTAAPSLVNGKMPAANVVVSGSWLFTPASQYSLTYQVTGEAPATFTPAIPAASNHNAGDDITLASGLTTTETSKGGVPGTWTFSGWTPTPALVGGKMPAANVVVSGSWTFTADPQYTLTYQVTGEAPATFTPAIPAVSSHYAGDDITLAAGLTTTETSKSGVTGTWTFSGWTAAPSLVNGKMPAANVVVSGSWLFTPDSQYSLTYQVTGEAPATFTPAIPAASNHNAGDDITIAAGLTTTETSKGGVTGTWTFSGWTAAPALVNGKMPAANVVVSGSWTFKADAPQGKTYAITFDPNGGTCAVKSSETGTDGKLSVLPTATRKGLYKFNGWYTAPNGGTKITTDYVFTADTTVYAQWSYIGGSGQINVPKTGDSSNPTLWLGLTAISILAIAGLAVKKRRNKAE